MKVLAMLVAVSLLTGCGEKKTAKQEIAEKLGIKILTPEQRQARDEAWAAKRAADRKEDADRSEAYRKSVEDRTRRLEEDLQQIHKETVKNITEAASR